MELHTLASAGKLLNVSAGRLKKWMNAGYVPEHRIHLGSVHARVIDTATVERLRVVIRAVDEDGFTVRSAFAKCF
jgi:hypothetical protein